MLPAQPPKSRRSAGTRKDTFRMCSWSGRICCAKRPSKVMMVSNARDPQMTAAMVCCLGKGSGIESEQSVARDAAATRGRRDGQREGGGPLGRSGDGGGRRAEFAREQHAAQHGLVLAIGQGQFDG